MQWFYSLSGWQQALLASTFTWAMTALGASLVFFCKKVNKTAFVFMMSSAAGIMMASAFFSLLLPALEMTETLPWLKISIGFLLGGLTIIVCDLLAQRLTKTQNQGFKRSVVMCAAVTVHNIPEGMAIGVAFGAILGGEVGVVAAIMLAIGIGIQNFPEGMCVAFPLRANGVSSVKSFLIGQFSGAVEIVSAVIGALAVSFVTELLPWALSYSAGAMLAVVCSELIPESFATDKTKATVGVVLGFCFMMVLDVAFG